MIPGIGQLASIAGYVLCVLFGGTGLLLLAVGWWNGNPATLLSAVICLGIAVALLS